MRENNLRRYFQFFLIVLAAGAIYPVIYLRTNYTAPILEVFNLSPVQLNNFYSMLGMAYVIGYIPSGFIADRFSAKKLIVVSLLGVSICGFWFAQVPSPGTVNVIFFLWGIFSVFTFWSSHMKIVKMLSKSNEVGRFFGILDGGRGAVEALMATVGTILFAKILGGSDLLADTRAGLVGVIYLYSAIVFVVAILILIFINDDKKLVAMSENSGKRTENEKFHFSQIGTLLKNKYVYFMGGIIFMGYTVFWTYYYLGGFLGSNIGVDAVTVSGVMVVAMWMRPIGGIIGGFLADKIGRPATNGWAIFISALLLAAIALIPATNSASLFYVIIIGLALCLFAIRGTYWSLLGQSKIEAAMMGTAIGLISFIGYLPDIILPQLNSFLWATFGDQGGYNAYFLVSAAFGAVGILLLIVYNRLSTREGVEG